MFEPIILQLQNALYRSVLGELQALLSGSRAGGAGGAGGRALRAHPSAFDDLIVDAARRYDLDPAMLKAVVHAESGFAPLAVSRAGAKGLTQLMDATAQRMGVTNPFDPAQNIDGGARYLRQMLDRYGGDPALALAAYNAGPGAVDRWGGLPPYRETQTYVPRVIDLWSQYREWTA